MRPRLIIIGSILIGGALGLAIYTSMHQHIYFLCVDKQFEDYQAHYFGNLGFTYELFQSKSQKLRQSHAGEQSRAFQPQNLPGATDTKALQKKIFPEQQRLSPIGLLRAHLDILDKQRRIWACTFPPDGIYNGTVDIVYPFPLPSQCPELPLRHDIVAAQIFWSHPPDDVLKSINAVGRLEIRSKNQHGPIPTFWATGFVIAKNDKGAIVATTCHAMDPLLATYKDPDTHKDEFFINIDHTKEDLVIDFGESRDEHDPAKECIIEDDAICSRWEGLDVALLRIQKNSCNPPGQVPHLYRKDSDKLTTGHILALVGYADFSHFIDPDTYDLYKPYEERIDLKLYSKFLMLDSVSAVSKCEPNLKLLFDVVDTTVGQSGAPLIDLPLFSPETSIAGIHSCCAAYFDQSRETTPQFETSCSHIRRTIDNQDVSMESVLADPILCKELKKYREDLKDLKCH